MKSLLALVTLALAALAIEEKARQAGGDALEVYDSAAGHVGDARQSLTKKVQQQPLISLLVAGGLGYSIASIVPKRRLA